MGLEAASFLHQLNPAWPEGPVDQRHQGDDHIRILKAALQGTFPGMAGRSWRVVNRSASGALTLTDNMTVQNAAGVTLTPDSATVLGNGWVCVVRAAGAAVTIDPPNNINGAGSYVVPDGYGAIVFSNGSEFFALLIYKEVPSTTPAFPAGTRMVFQQTAAPSGWTKDVSAVYNDATFRSTTGTVATGGTDAFTTTFGTGKLTGGRAITIAQMPVHDHPQRADDHGISGTGSGYGSNWSGRGVQTRGESTATAGSGQSHDHPLNNMNIKYVDMIVASKN